MLDLYLRNILYLAIQLDQQTKNTMKTLENNNSRKVKSIEVQYSNMTFVIQAHTHFIVGMNSGWSKTKYTAFIKETGQGIGSMGSRKLIKSQMELINSKPDLFLN